MLNETEKRILVETKKNIKKLTEEARKGTSEELTQAHLSCIRTGAVMGVIAVLNALNITLRRELGEELNEIVRGDN